MVLIGIQPGSIDMDTELTAAVEVKVDELVRMVLIELAAWGIEPLPN
jgi:Ni,Fe-hydrogenase maturation factor